MCSCVKRKGEGGGGEVPPARRRPPDSPRGLQRLETEQVLTCLVLRELHTAPNNETRAGRA